MRLVVEAAGFLLFLTIASAGASTQTPPTTEYESAYGRLLDKVVALWDEYDVIALSEHHGSRLGAKLRTDIVRHPGFAAQIGHILIESAAVTRQQLLDRYIVEGADVPQDQLVRIWRDTGQRPWDAPIYQRFLTVVRDINRSRPEGRRIRILAGDFGFDMGRIKTGKEMLSYLDRGDFPVHIADCQILRPGHKALFVFGGGHLYHNYARSFVTFLDRLYPGRIAVIEVASGGPRNKSALAPVLDADPLPVLVNAQMGGLPNSASPKSCTANAVRTGRQLARVWTLSSGLVM